MRKLLTALLGLFFTLSPALAKDTPPWENAQAVLDAAAPDLRAGGIRAMGPHAPDFEQALTNADKPYDDGNEDPVLLTDGPMDQVFALAVAAKALPGKKVTTVRDPYAEMALYLASYYNEVGRHEDALRVLEQQKARTVGTFGDHCAALTSERAVALMQLKRLAEALAVYEEGLSLDNIDDSGKARMQRGRGYVLTEMDRLDEAEAAYKESLKLEPGNQLAQGELDYIAKLRAGGDKAPGGIVLPGDQPKTD
jgi:tetratricopeptide (TPR) repeat protein